MINIEFIGKGTAVSNGISFSQGIHNIDDNIAEYLISNFPSEFIKVTAAPTPKDEVKADTKKAK